MEEAIEERAVFEEEVTKLLIDGKDAVSVNNIDELEGHRGSAPHGVEITAGRAKAAVAAEGDKFQLTALRAAVHSAAERRVTAAQHTIDIFHHRRSGMKSIFDFFIIVSKNFLKDIHKIIMREKVAKRNP